MKIIKTSINNWIIVISVVLGVLVLSLGEMGLKDTARLFKVRSETTILEELHTVEEKSISREFTESISSLSTRLKDDENKLDNLNDDIRSKKEIIDQLLENQKVNPNTETELSIKEFQKQYLNLQNTKQEAKSRILSLDSELTKYKRDSEDFHNKLSKKYKETVLSLKREESKSREFKILLTQLITILLSLVLGFVLFRKFRKTKYFPPVLGYNISVTIIFIQAIYVHSPFKLHYYTFILIGLGICITAIILLIKNISKLTKKESLKIIKKSLIVGRCPSCTSNISLKPSEIRVFKGNKLKSFLLTVIILTAILSNGSGIVIFVDNASGISADELFSSLFLILFPWILVYFFLRYLSPFAVKNVPDPGQFNNNNCPVCGLKLISKCSKCGEKRHNLLPYCNNCGDKISDKTAGA